MYRAHFTPARARIFAAAALFVAAASWHAEAGGPLFLLNGTPILWANRVVQGGPLNSATVTIDRQGRRNVIYHVDGGTLGPLTNAQAVRFTERIFGEFSNIPTSNIRFVDGGPIRDPASGLPVDVNATNIGAFLDGDNPTFQNPIIFDSDGQITGGGGVLGFFGALTFEPDFSAITEGFVVLNGAVITPPALISTTSFLGVFQHEFGHLAGPLDHEQINGNIALFRPEAAIPAGFTNRTQTNDLFAPFTETTYPFLFGAPAASVLRASGFPDSGYFIATLDMDTKNALSNLYPTKSYRTTTGSIEGQVFFRSNRGGRVPVNGINVVARRIDRAPYPPPLGTQAFPTPPVLDADGVPAPPPPQAATDSLATASSAVTGLDFGHGTFRIQGLPPGRYEVMLQAINPQATGGSGIGALNFQLTLPVIEEYFRKGGTSNVVSDFTPVRVEAGRLTKEIDLEINGLDLENFSRAIEAPDHSSFATAQDLGALPARVRGSASVEDPFTVGINLGGGVVEGVPDLYRVQTTAPAIVWMSLEARRHEDDDGDDDGDHGDGHDGDRGDGHGRGEGHDGDHDAKAPPPGDLDLFLFRLNPTGTVSLFRFALTDSPNEILGLTLAPATYFIGIGAFDGSVKYDLRVMKNIQ